MYYLPVARSIITLQQVLNNWQCVMVLMPCKVMMWASPCPCGPCISSVSLNMTLCFLKGQDTRGESRIISFRDHDGISDDFQVTHISNMDDVHSKPEYFQISLDSFYTARLTGQSAWKFQSAKATNGCPRT